MLFISYKCLVLDYNSCRRDVALTRSSMVLGPFLFSASHTIPAFAPNIDSTVVSVTIGKTSAIHLYGYIGDIVPYIASTVKRTPRTIQNTILFQARSISDLPIIDSVKFH